MDADIPLSSAWLIRSGAYATWNHPLWGNAMVNTVNLADT